MAIRLGQLGFDQLGRRLAIGAHHHLERRSILDLGKQLAGRPRRDDGGVLGLFREFGADLLQRSQEVGRHGHHHLIGLGHRNLTKSQGEKSQSKQRGGLFHHKIPFVWFSSLSLCVCRHNDSRASVRVRAKRPLTRLEQPIPA